jgi:alpha-mannosidase
VGIKQHWFVNFKAQQDGQIRLRYSLTSMTGHLDVEKAVRFSAEVRTPPVVLRDRRPVSPTTAAILRVVEGADIVVGSKVSEDGTGVVVRLVNFKRHRQNVTIDLGAPLLGAWVARPDEREQALLETDGSSVTTVVGVRCAMSLLLKW